MKLSNKLILIIIALVTTSALANTIRPEGLDNWEMYVLGGASVFEDIFTGIITFINSGAFMSLAMFVALVGFLILMIQSVGGLDPKKVVPYFIGIWAAGFLTFQSKVDLTIIDSIGANSFDQSRIVLGVPSSIGLPAAWLSSIGESFTTLIDANFSRPHPTLKFANTKSLNMDAQLFKDMLTMHPFNPELSRSLSVFYSDCVFPLIAQGIVPISVLMTSDNMLDQIEGDLNPALSTVDYTDGATLKNCVEVYSGATGGTNYKTQISVAVGAYLNQDYNLSPHVNSSDSAGMSTAPLGTIATAMLDSMHTAAGAAIPSPTDVVKNRAVGRAFDAGMNSTGSSTGIDKDQLSGFLIEEQTFAQTTEGWRMAIETFNSMSVYIFTVLHAFVIGISPIIIVFMFLPGVAGKAILSYFQILVWLALWQPMLAIVNFVIVSFQDNALATIVSQAPTGAFGSAAAPESWMSINAALDKYTLAAGFLGTMVPMLSWGIVKGGMAFTQFISAGIGTSVAAGAAKNLATGTLSMDNSSYNNQSGNKSDTVSTIKSGQGMSEFSMVYGDGVNRAEVEGDNTHTKGTMVSKMSSSMVQTAIESANMTSLYGAGDNLQAGINQIMTDKQQAAQQATAQYAKVVTSTDTKAISDAKMKMDTANQQLANTESDTGQTSAAQERKQTAQYNAARLLFKGTEGNADFANAMKSNEKEALTAQHRKQWEESADYREAIIAAGSDEDKYLEDILATSSHYKNTDVNGMKDTATSMVGNAFAVGLGGALRAASKALGGAKKDDGNTPKFSNPLTVGVAGIAAGVETLIPTSEIKGSSTVGYQTSYANQSKRDSGGTVASQETVQEQLQTMQAHAEALNKSAGYAKTDSRSIDLSEANQATNNKMITDSETVQNAVQKSTAFANTFTFEKNLSRAEKGQYVERLKNVEDSLPTDFSKQGLEGHAPPQATSEDLSSRGQQTVEEVKAKTDNLKEVAKHDFQDPNGEALSNEVKLGQTNQQNLIAEKVHIAKGDSNDMAVTKNNAAEDYIRISSTGKALMDELGNSRLLNSSAEDAHAGAENMLKALGGKGDKHDLSQINAIIDASNDTTGQPHRGTIDPESVAAGVAKTDGFTASFAEFTNINGEINTDLIYTKDEGPEGAEYKMDDQGDMQRVDENFEKTARVAETTTENSDFKEYGLTRDGQEIFRRVEDGKFAEGNTIDDRILGSQAAIEKELNDPNLLEGKGVLRTAGEISAEADVARLTNDAKIDELQSSYDTQMDSVDEPNTVSDDKLTSISNGFDEVENKVERHGQGRGRYRDNEEKQKERLVAYSEDMASTEQGKAELSAYRDSLDDTNPENDKRIAAMDSVLDSTPGSRVTAEELSEIDNGFNSAETKSNTGMQKRGPRSKSHDPKQEAEDFAEDMASSKEGRTELRAYRDQLSDTPDNANRLEAIDKVLAEHDVAASREVSEQQIQNMGKSFDITEEQDSGMSNKLQEIGATLPDDYGTQTEKYAEMKASTEDGRAELVAYKATLDADNHDDAQRIETIDNALNPQENNNGEK